jgi:hypothetical protein
MDCFSGRAGMSSVGFFAVDHKSAIGKIKLTECHKHSHCITCNVSQEKKQVRVRRLRKATYDVIVRIATSPNDMGGMSSDPKIPTSQPAHQY